MIGAICKDRTKKEHVAKIDKVIWCDDDQPVSILALADGHSAIVPAKSDQFTRGQFYRFLGRWEEGRRGLQFRAATFVHEQPASSAAVVKYLADHCSGIGNKTALKLADKYGGDAVRMLREDPGQVAADNLLSLDAARTAAEELARFSNQERTRVALFGLFAGRGFPGKLVERSIAKWGAKAPKVIEANPYRLMVAKLPGCGFKRCDKLWLDSGRPAAALKRQFLSGYAAAREDRTGSTWLDADKVVESIKAAVAGPECDPLKAIRLGLRAAWMRIRRVGKARWLAVASHAQAEQRIADAVRRLSAAVLKWPTDLPVSVVEGDGLPSGHQVGELRKATSSPVGCFTGGPGSGKTHTLSFLLRAVIEEHGPDAVAVCAPTGKAAERATESLAARQLAVRATTIHRLLEIGRSGHDGDGWGFQRNRDNPLPYRFLVVDESSMIGAGLMADLLDACGGGTHVLFVGDTFQLSPVEHGAPLRDFIASGAVGVGELTEIRRNAGTIVRACEAIKAGKPAEPAAEFDLDATDPANLRLVDLPDAAVLDHVEETLLAMTRFDRVWDVQVITALNEKSDLSRKKINERLAKLLNPDGKRVHGCPFAINDKIICLRNSQLTSVRLIMGVKHAGADQDTGWYEKAGDDETTFVSNGQIGRVAALGQKEVIFDFAGKRVSVPIGKARPAAEGEDGEPKGGGLSDFDLAYAITVHKSQGSEWPCVIGIIDPAGGSIADRNFWYTAISRAKTACLLVGDRKAFASQCNRWALVRRKTFLAELIRGEGDTPAAA